MHIYEHPEQKRFVLGDLSKLFGVGSAPIYQILINTRPDLIETKEDGRIVFERSLR